MLSLLHLSVKNAVRRPRIPSDGQHIPKLARLNWFHLHLLNFLKRPSYFEIHTYSLNKSLTRCLIKQTVQIFTRFVLTCCISILIKLSCSARDTVFKGTRRANHSHHSEHIKGVNAINQLVSITSSSRTSVCVPFDTAVKQGRSKMLFRWSWKSIWSRPHVAYVVHINVVDIKNDLHMIDDLSEHIKALFIIYVTCMWNMHKCAIC